ncbi:hypothetical protein Aple_024600 [Acrocarpospora pleiomorpha]|uniref:Uncharacterized protein n=1 Tax=Acrocarpospora pleiomorpha TaxID=90975 RepID=A0A5M3XE75_9ACTN|nr:hypothetical protein [Acrocarpospora pleiomorpha]GES19564.1 hypothetical protein Aple_024600 [Acrocarpospora pleiomorpha]
MPIGRDLVSIALTEGENGPGLTLTNQGGGRYAEQRGWVFNPLRITVKSNFGGSATAST